MRHNNKIWCAITDEILEHEANIRKKLRKSD